MRRDELPHLKRLVPEDEKAGDGVRNGILGGEANGDAGHAEAGQGRADVDAELAGRHDQPQTEQGELVEVVDQETDQRVGEFRPLEHPPKWRLADLENDPEGQQHHEGGQDAWRERDPHVHELLWVQQSQRVFHGASLCLVRRDGLATGVRQGRTRHTLPLPSRSIRCV